MFSIFTFLSLLFLLLPPSLTVGKGDDWAPDFSLDRVYGALQYMMKHAAALLQAEAQACSVLASQRWRLAGRGLFCTGQPGCSGHVLVRGLWLLVAQTCLSMRAGAWIWPDMKQL
ncbi:hypothetical protein DPEC_G00209410 [Dallia pectoralis]|uniref:Uncharacterized protein n=1 Tax=Dallia pectoralis TaxID=75939 RepID=A0ACC2G5Q0_DALPE|nr:hypothetical protein DPEC_G00209410 [Dallia pectoralis]